MTQRKQIKSERKFSLWCRLTLVNQHRRLRNSASAIFLFLLCGCATTPRNFSQIDQGMWQAKVLVRDKQADHSGIVNVAIKAMNAPAVSARKLRLDITSAMGTYLGSVAINGRHMDYLSVDNRTLYHTVASARAMRVILKVPVEPNLLFDILFDHAPTAGGWQCAKDKYGYPQTCANKRSQLKVTWLSRNGDSRTIEIDHPTAQVQMNLFNFKNQIAGAKSAFTLKAPHSFKVKNLEHRRTSRSETLGRN